MYNLLTWLFVVVAVLAVLFVLNSREFAGGATVTVEHGNPVIAPR
jgi:preprotein translocase subunit SecG